MKKGLAKTNLNREDVIEKIIRKKKNKKVIIVVGLKSFLDKFINIVEIVFIWGKSY